MRATIGLIRVNLNNSRPGFELTVSSLIEVDPHRRKQRKFSNKGGGGDQDYGTSFPRKGRSRVDLRWHRPKENKEFSSNEKDKLSQCQSSSEGVTTLEKLKKEAFEQS